MESCQDLGSLIIVCTITYMCSTNSVFVCVEENKKRSATVIQAICQWRHPRLDSQTHRKLKWEENGQFTVADQQKTTHRT